MWLRPVHRAGASPAYSLGTVDFPVVRRAPVIRTCVGCRRRVRSTELLRVIAVGHTTGLRLVVDPARRLPGRGAHVHPDPACLALADRRRAFGRALRLTGVVDTAALAEYIEQAHAATPATEDEREPRPSSTTKG
ncbi:YlxR family protein [Phytomonospora sp. NPDC050363]|uniref:YlxR family protein n=1 Tax=Phytomonospora sp. NPDC050363 TaxID=3155642 RepID=UPI0033D4E1D7